MLGGPAPGDRDNMRTADGAGAVERPVRRIHLATLLAGALAIGITAGWQQPTPLVWPWLTASATLTACAALARFVFAWKARFTMLLLCGSMATLGAGWVTLRQHYFTADNLAAWMGDEQVLVRVRGFATGPSTMRARTGGSLARFDYRQPATYFPMQVEALLSRDGAAHPVAGSVLVRVDEAVAPFRSGDRIDVMGFLLRPAGPRNPGEFDYREYAKSLGQAGFLSVPRRDLVKITATERWSPYVAFLNGRDELRRRAGAWLLADLPHTPRTERDSLLANLLLGERQEQIDGVYGVFQRVGLAHILAISGFHLAVLAGFVLMALRLFGGHRRWHGWLVIAVVLVYLAMVEVRMPVLRAGVMTIAACLAFAFGRRLRAGGLVSLSAILLLLWRPDQLFNAGFQLTYGVVLGLIYLAPALRIRWFGHPNLEATSTGQMILEWTKTTLIASLAAWVIATPIAMHHFGVISPLGALVSVVAIPLSALILALGYVKIVLSAILPSAALLLGIPLSIAADVLLAGVWIVDAVKWSSAPTPTPTAVWTLAALAWAWWWMRARRRRWKWVTPAQLLGLLALWICLMWPFDAAPRLRIDMLAVGDGSCYAIRGGGATVVFDAGSSTDLNVAARSLIPAMRRLGIRSVDAIVISHADIDHYSAVLELAEEFDVNEVLVSPQFLAEAAASPAGPVGFTMERLTDERILTRTIFAGEQRTFGTMRWRWLNPQDDRAYERANNGSMVVRIEGGGRSVLLCGDIQRESMQELMQRESAELLRADFMELPHHGSHHDTAEQFVRAVGPSIVMQSTGWSRWKRDRWARALEDADRLVTARDGACWIEVDGGGAFTTGKFLREGYVPTNELE